MILNIEESKVDAFISSACKEYHDALLKINILRVHVSLSNSYQASSF